MSILLKALLRVFPLINSVLVILNSYVASYVGLLNWTLTFKVKEYSATLVGKLNR